MPVVTTTSPSVKPGDFLPDPNSPFFMSNSDFLDIQRYCDAGTQLPTTNKELADKLGISTSDTDKFQELLSAYQNVSTHCGDFRTNTFKQTVDLANDIADYALKASGTYYPALNTIIGMWQDGSMAPDKAKAKVDAILATLKQDVLSNAKKASDMQTKVAAFANETINDKAILDPIKTKYDAQYEGQGGLIAQLKTQIQADSDQIDYWNKEYQKDVTIACTSATYAWVVPYGTIAAAVVAGIYGKRAQDALDQVHKFQDEKAAASTQEQIDITLMADMHLASNSISGILDAIKGALKVLTHMEGIWNSLAADITSIGSTLQSVDVDPLIIKDLDIDAAIAEWKTVETEAKTYAVNAFITVTTEADIKSKPAALYLVQKRQVA